MSRRIAWLPAALPAAIAGHIVAYALAGQVQNDAHHAYLIPALEYSAMLFAGLCIARIFSAFAAHKPPTALMRLDELWLRLSIAQILLYVAVESVEGVTVTAVALCAQVAVAFLAALALTGFSRVIARCERAAIEGSRYLERRATPLLHVFFSDRSTAYALCIAAGTARFQRPPPSPSR